MYIIIPIYILQYILHMIWKNLILVSAGLDIKHYYIASIPTYGGAELYLPVLVCIRFAALRNVVCYRIETQ